MSEQKLARVLSDKLAAVKTPCETNVADEISASAQRANCSASVSAKARTGLPELVWLQRREPARFG
jgi:hypothetical protein